ncbi:hypothetical protein Rumeso_02607 [Rubellimicrobium mesophilum DSM 19309]|uniref:Extensin-like C-terminal domain-containing protein n=1 Tax=Rubellimicrobium mesophilum DSM 19309 TaxID=442562 RepID=A0A017HNC8_9RHOB|nr:extensin family protein [Rubellimicrobium mesophilum]EYD75825.1 hypothetical protein Rumeso_02607 [Rubellimicrobium mesophilum DSM 19309]
MRRAALAFALAGQAALAQEGTDFAPERAPIPEARPDGGVPQLIPSEAPDAGATEAEGPAAAADDTPQLIPPRGMDTGSPAAGFTLTGPDGPDEGEGLSFGLPEAAPEGGANATLAPDQGPAETPVPPGPPMRELLAESSAELSACLAALDDLGVTYERADHITDPDNPDCGIANPSPSPRSTPGVALEPPPTLRCDATLAAARWVAEVVLPFSRKLPDRGALTTIDQGTAYLCRPRADGEVSEHAFGNALDVMGFRFASGDPFLIQPRDGDGTLDESFQAAVRAGACLDFTTVLGPGQEDHADHLHLDVKGRDGGFRICE